MGKARENINIPRPIDLPDPRNIPQPVRQRIVDIVLSAFERTTLDRAAPSSEEIIEQLVSILSRIPEPVAPPVIAGDRLPYLGDNQDNSNLFSEDDGPHIN